MITTFIYQLYNNGIKFEIVWNFKANIESAQKD